MGSDFASEGSTGPKKIGSLLNSIKAFKILDAWKEVAGPALLKVAEFQGISFHHGHRFLILIVKDSAWRQELEFQKNEILQRYCAALQKRGLKGFDLPEMISFTLNPSVPVRTSPAQTGRYKSGIKS